MLPPVFVAVLLAICVSLFTGVDRKAKSKREKNIVDLLKKYDQEVHPVGVFLCFYGLINVRIIENNRPQLSSLLLE